MVGAFYNGISGIRTHQFGIDSTSNNIANVNTVGYRANLPEFKSLFATSMSYVNANSPISNDYNYGSTIGSNAINANDGTYVSAEGDFNVAYSGKGWFVVGLNKNGAFDINAPVYNGTQQNYFTRDGSFSLDGEGYLVNSSGYYMYGINLGKIAADGTMTGTNNLEGDYAGLSGSNLQPLQIPKNLTYKPTLTTEVGLSINLNRTQNPKGIGNLKDENDNFSMDKFLTQDLNALMNAKGELLDPKNYKDINISLERGGVTTKYTFTYGGAENGFKTIGELMNLIKEQTGLTLGLKLDSEGNPSDCSLYLSNGGMQDVKVSINGKLADKLGLKSSNNNLESAFGSAIQGFVDNTEYQNQALVKYNGMIFQKNGDGIANGNPLDNPDGWTLVDSSGVPAYQGAQAKEYKQDELVISEGKVYRKLTNDVTEVTNPITGEVTIAAPEEDAANWEEVANATLGEVQEYTAGTTYAQDSIVSYNGILYRKTNGAGDTNPAEDNRGWSILSVASISSTQLQVPTYETNTEIYSDSGEKFILKTQYILVEQANRDVTPEVLERWEVRSSIYDGVGKVMISENPTISEITFNDDG
ncbi:flagellar hook-basal body complex protein, partial [Helicobacter ganmani]